jgi:type II secretory ATPase GspE/PulE/Tfp pilus assembly ATPase PilB-like protein
MSFKIDATLRRIARQQEEEAAAQLALRLGVAYDRFENYPFNLDILSKVPLPTAKEKKIACYIYTSTKARVAAVNPEDPAVLETLKEYAGEWGVPIELTVVSPSTFQEIILTYTKLHQEHELQLKQYHQEQAALEKKNYFHHVHTLEDLQSEVESASTTEILDVILAAAVNQNASDVHIEPGDELVTVRFRIDGVLQPVLRLPRKNHQAVVSRVKVMSGMRLDEHNLNQDGRFTLADKGIDADVRVSIIPTGYEEGIVMRILRQDIEITTLDELGFTEYNRKLIEGVIHKPYGLILVTGPTGSGKSTTLYTILRMLNSPEKKIITLEDPIEYRLEGIQQSQVDPEKGYSFAEGLKGALRQDPDIIMVGEIRDAETATIALNASLTGHLVLSTLHTNNAVAVHTRLLEMGIEPFLISGSIQMIIAQRLVRRLVPGSTAGNPHYKGRVVIAEILVPNHQFEEAVLNKQDEYSLQQIAVAGGMVPIHQDGLEKVRQGVTTEEEVNRVTEVG